MRTLPKRSHAFVAGVIGLLLSTSLAPKARASFAGSPEGAAKADRDSVLNWVESDFPKTLNPTISSSATENDIIQNATIFESLIGADPDTGEASCWLCKDFTYDAADKRIITFKLRDDVFFHDGKPLSAADVKFSFDASLHPKVDNLNQKSALAAVVDKVEVVDPLTIKVTAKTLGFSNIYTIGSVPILPKHLFDYFEKTPEKFNKDQKFGRNPLGSGPYKFVKWQGDKLIELERNENWWGFKAKDPRFAGLFNFKKIRFKIITDSNVQMQAFKKGEIDFMNLQSFQYDDLRKDKALPHIVALHLEPKVSTSWMYIAWNARKPIFRDVKTRQALAMLTDRKSTLEKFSRGLRPPTNGPFGVNSPLSCPLDKCPVQPFDPAGAKKLLAEAGWQDTDGDGCLDRMEGESRQVLKFAILGDSSDYNKNLLDVYITEMKKAGVCAEPRLLDWSAMHKLVDDQNFDAFVSGFRQGFPELPRQLWHSENMRKSGSNFWAYSDPESDKLIETYEQEFDTAKRQELARKLHEKIYAAHPAVWHHEGGGCLIGHNKVLEGVAVANYSTSCVFWPRWFKQKK